MTPDTRPIPIDVSQHRIYIGRRYEGDREPHVWVRPIRRPDYPDFEPYSLNDALINGKLPRPGNEHLAEMIEADHQLFDWNRDGYSDPERLLAYAILCDADGVGTADDWYRDFAKQVLTEIDGTQWAMQTTWDWFQPNPTLENWLEVAEE